MKGLESSGLLNGLKHYPSPFPKGLVLLHSKPRRRIRGAQLLFNYQLLRCGLGLRFAVSRTASNCVTTLLSIRFMHYSSTVASVIATIMAGLADTIKATNVASKLPASDFEFVHHKNPIFSTASFLCQLEYCFQFTLCFVFNIHFYHHLPSGLKRIQPRYLQEVHTV